MFSNGVFNVNFIGIILCILYLCGDPAGCTCDDDSVIPVTITIEIDPSIDFGRG